MVYSIFETTETTAAHIFDAAFNNFVVLRVTGEGGTALASARTVVNEEGFASQGDEEPCELDENGFSIILDENGQFIRCTADSLPETDQDGVIEILGSIPVTIDIEPRSTENSIPCNQNNKLVTVAILTTDDFDVFTIDATMVLFEGALDIRVAQFGSDMNLLCGGC